MEGYGVFTWKNGTVYKGFFKSSQKQGKGEIQYGEKSKLISYKGEFYQDKKCGYGVQKTKEGIYKGYFKNNQYHGNGRFEYKNGAILEGDWE